MTMNFSMQTGLFDPMSAKPVTVIGAGSVGSNIIDMLARVGCTDITIYDGDAIESHNIPSSRFSKRDLGYFKVDVARRRTEHEIGINLLAYGKNYDGSKRLRGSVIASVDTMAARKTIWDAVKDNPLVDVFIDTRVAMKFFSIFTIRPCVPDDIAHYEQFLYDDAETHVQTCGNHGIITTSVTVAAIAVEYLCSYWQDASVTLQANGSCGREFFFPKPSNTKGD